MCSLNAVGVAFEKRKKKKRAGLQSQQVFSNLYLSFCPTFPSGQTLHHRLFETVGPPQQEECSDEECFHTGHTEAGTQLVKRVKNLFYFFGHK